MRVVLPSHTENAQSTELAYQELRYHPSYMDIAGDHVYVMRNISEDNIHLFNWRKKQFVHLPTVSALRFLLVPCSSVTSSNVFFLLSCLPNILLLWGLLRRAPSRYK
jgi:hypothetical protein